MENSNSYQTDIKQISNNRERTTSEQGYLDKQQEQVGGEKM